MTTENGELLIKNVINSLNEKIEKVVSHLNHELERIRTGRASIHMLDPVKVNSYGSLVPLNQVANISIPEPRLIVITPWDKGQIKEIEKGIVSANLGYTPSTDGSVVRIAIPPLNEERRKEFVKEVKKEGENAKVGVRNARKDANNEIDKLLKEKRITEDMRDNEKITTQEEIDKYIKKIDEIVAKKEKEVMTV